MLILDIYSLFTTGYDMFSSKNKAYNSMEMKFDGEQLPLN